MTNVSSAASLHVQIFRHVFRAKHRATHDEPGMPGMHRFEVITPHQFVCTVSSKPELAVHDASLAPMDQLIFIALKRSTQAIQACISKFSPKRGKGTIRGGTEVDEVGGCRLLVHALHVPIHSPYIKSVKNHFLSVRSLCSGTLGAIPQVRGQSRIRLASKGTLILSPFLGVRGSDMPPASPGSY